MGIRGFEGLGRGIRSPREEGLPDLVETLFRIQGGGGQGSGFGVRSLKFEFGV